MDLLRIFSRFANSNFEVAKEDLPEMLRVELKQSKHFFLEAVKSSSVPQRAKLPKRRC